MSRHSTLINSLLLLLAFAALLITIPEATTRILLIGALAICLAATANYVLARKNSASLRNIVHAVEKIRAGDLDAMIAETANDDIGKVAAAVNEMAMNLREDVAEMKKLQRVRSEFLGNVSHELRTPIFSLQGFLETLIDGAIDDPAVNRDFLKKAFSHSQRLNTLLGELITISQIESGEMKMSFRYFDIHEFLSDMLAEFRPTARHYGVTLALHTTVPHDVQVLGDKERLQVVLENLLENAIKYNRPSGHVSISYELDHAKIKISITDTGVGIPNEHLPRIFERFYRVDKNRSREVGGTGLGLAIVKHIIEAHGSNVSVTSQEGKGSTFSFFLKM